jgi:hypothetical protein
MGAETNADQAADFTNHNPGGVVADRKKSLFWPGTRLFHVFLILFKNFELGGFPCPEQFAQRRVVTWVLKIRIDGIVNVIENDARRVNRYFLVFCLVPSDTVGMKARTPSDVMDESSMSLKWS